MGFIVRQLDARTANVLNIGMPLIMIAIRVQRQSAACGGREVRWRDRRSGARDMPRSLLSQPETWTDRPCLAIDNIDDKLQRLFSNSLLT
jgi:hypothetical protein